MSESHFMSFFKQVTGLSFVAYFNHFRIERAQALLAKTEESMVSISQQVGFCDQSYFGTVFRKIVGMTPAAYRQRVRSGTSADQGRSTHIPSASIAGSCFILETDSPALSRFSAVEEQGTARGPPACMALGTGAVNSTAVD